VLHVVLTSWKPEDLELAATAARILCVMGLFRALGLLGPPLLDGTNHPQLTLRYMVVATICVPGSFWLGAVVLGDRLGFLSVAAAWAIGYPLAFVALAYLVVRTIRLPVRDYVAGCGGIIISCGAGIGAGFAMAALLPPVDRVAHMLVVGGASLAVTLGLLATWQKITPGAIVRSLR
jgi:O-antigen/teichoic acid export membrane protein